MQSIRGWVRRMSAGLRGASLPALMPVEKLRLEPIGSHQPKAAATHTIRANRTPFARSSEEGYILKMPPRKSEWSLMIFLTMRVAPDSFPRGVGCSHQAVAAAERLRVRPVPDGTLVGEAAMSLPPQCLRRGVTPERTRMWRWVSHRTHPSHKRDLRDLARGGRREPQTVRFSKFFNLLEILEKRNGPLSSLDQYGESRERRKGMERVARVLDVTFMAVAVIVRAAAAFALWSFAFAFVWIGAVMVDNHPDPTLPEVQNVAWLTYVLSLALMFFGAMIFPGRRR